MSMLGMVHGKGFYTTGKMIPIDDNGITASNIYNKGLYICVVQYTNGQRATCPLIVGDSSTMFSSEFKAGNYMIGAKFDNYTITAISSSGFEDTSLLAVYYFDILLAEGEQNV